MTVAHLRRHRTAQRQAHLAAGVGWAEDDFVFTSRRGAPLDPSNLTGAWHAFTEAAGVGRVRFHALRHTAATVLPTAGVPLAVISKNLATVTIVMITVTAFLDRNTNYNSSRDYLLMISIQVVLFVLFECVGHGRHRKRLAPVTPSPETSCSEQHRSRLPPRRALSQRSDWRTARSTTMTRHPCQQSGGERHHSAFCAASRRKKYDCTARPGESSGDPRRSRPPFPQKTNDEEDARQSRGAHAVQASPTGGRVHASKVAPAVMAAVKRTDGRTDGQTHGRRRPRSGPCRGTSSPTIMASRPMTSRTLSPRPKARKTNDPTE